MSLYAKIGWSRLNRSWLKVCVPYYFIILFIYTKYCVTQPGLAWLGLGWAVTIWSINWKKTWMLFLIQLMLFVIQFDVFVVQLDVFLVQFNGSSATNTSSVTLRTTGKC